VTLLLAPAGDDLELLLMERALRADDPWSGQVALPGGRFDRGDDSLLTTALRELREEAGVQVAPSQVLGELDELRPRIAALPSVIVRPYVAAVDRHPHLTANHEAAALFWVPLSTLSDPSRRVQRSVVARGLRMQVEGIDLDGRLLWGMTERILAGLTGLLR
jgi:8-oxo-dGTP pyrophosphatase MutT (NUDIX family)